MNRKFLYRSENNNNIARKMENKDSYTYELNSAEYIPNIFGPES